ncbi:MAG: hypothetical protein NVV74_23265 [Magnetospirillum sp.]|nr:hypothetical protein [Magnetospirillum sp.]
MHPTLKFLHLLGLALFLGSLPAHIILGAIAPGGDIPSQGILFARTVMKVITLVATVPGLVLLALTGLLRWRAARWEAGRRRWLSCHVALGLVAVANGLAVLTPAVLDLAAQAQTMVDGVFVPAQWDRTKLLEDVAGGINLLVALAGMALACFRPALAWRLDRSRPAL